MRKIKSRLIFLLALLVTSAMVSSFASKAQAGQWVADVQFNCGAKRTAGAPLFYPMLDPESMSSLYSITCGKLKPALHGILTLCQAASVSPNGKKPSLASEPNNCTINWLMHITGRCAASSGAVLGIITMNRSSGGKKTVVLDLEGADQVQWNNAVGGNLLITGSTNKGLLVADAQMTPDLATKNESCMPSATGNDGADGLIIQGTGTITGAKTK